MRELLLESFRAAVGAADPQKIIAAHLPHAPVGRTFVAEGTRVIVHLLASPLRVRSLLLEPKWFDEFRPAIEARPETDIEVFVASREEVAKIVGFQAHQGAMAVADEPVSPELFGFAREPGSCALPTSSRGCVPASSRSIHPPGGRRR